MNNLFQRYEFKYLLTPEVLCDFMPDILNFMQPDPFAQSFENSAYPIRSLYYDTADYLWYFEKVTGVKKREKIRIRTYSFHEHDDAPIFLEVKGRNDNHVIKRRLQINNSELNAIQKLENLPFSVQYEDSERVYDSFLRFHYKKKITPKIMVDYLRTPLISQFDHAFRVTVDHELKVKCAKGIYDNGVKPWLYPLASSAILEVKFERHLPKWFGNIIRKYQLSRVSISKYCVGIEALDLASEE